MSQRRRCTDPPPPRKLFTSFVFYVLSKLFVGRTKRAGRPICPHVKTCAIGRAKLAATQHRMRRIPYDVLRQCRQRTSATLVPSEDTSLALTHLCKRFLIEFLAVERRPRVGLRLSLLVWLQAQAGRRVALSPCQGRFATCTLSVLGVC